MGIFSPHLKKALSYIDPAASAIGRNDPIAKSVVNYVVKKPGAPGPLAPPTQDTAANADIQQQQALLRRRGILGNIYAGGNASQPTTASKTALGN